MAPVAPRKSKRDTRPAARNAIAHGLLKVVAWTMPQSVRQNPDAAAVLAPGSESKKTGELDRYCLTAQQDESPAAGLKEKQQMKAKETSFWKAPKRTQKRHLLGHSSLSSIGWRVRQWTLWLCLLILRSHSQGRPGCITTHEHATGGHISIAAVLSSCILGAVGRNNPLLTDSRSLWPAYAWLA